jgi:hypothetical protein
MLTKIKMAFFLKTTTYTSSKAQLPHSTSYIFKKYSNDIVLIMTVTEVLRTDRTFLGGSESMSWTIASS